ncbi:MAG: hypothetical protein K2K54_02685 [Lachnospiraceae bacterium]|nr:hypothetical protein [Lachnospiraceae bacterium]
MAYTEEKYKQALKGKELPLLPLDNKWHQLFTQTEANPRIRRLEEQLNSLIKRQGKLNTEKKDIRKLKRKLMDQIVVTVDELDQGINQKINDKKIDADKRLVKECNTKLAAYEKELMTLPKQIEEVNLQLMLATMDICYKKIKENTAQIEELTEWIDSMRIELKKNVVRKQDRETENRQLYSYMHDIFGADVLEVFDMKYNPLEQSSKKAEK